jgi:hypothetical protein
MVTARANPNHRRVACARVGGFRGARQVGLDADNWLTPTPSHRLSDPERKDGVPMSMVAQDADSAGRNVFTEAHAHLTKHAESEASVKRFVVRGAPRTKTAHGCTFAPMSARSLPHAHRLCQDARPITGGMPHDCRNGAADKADPRHGGRSAPQLPVRAWALTPVPTGQLSPVPPSPQ